MQTHTPTQAEVLDWMSIFLAEKLNQATQDKDWTRVTAILSIINAIAECMEELEAKC